MIPASSSEGGTGEYCGGAAAPGGGSERRQRGHEPRRRQRRRRQRRQAAVVAAAAACRRQRWSGRLRRQVARCRLRQRRNRDQTGRRVLLRFRFRLAGRARRRRIVRRTRATRSSCASATAAGQACGQEPAQAPLVGLGALRRAGGDTTKASVVSSAGDVAVWACRADRCAAICSSNAAARASTASNSPGAKSSSDVGSPIGRFSSGIFPLTHLVRRRAAATATAATINATRRRGDGEDDPARPHVAQVGLRRPADR